MQKTAIMTTQSFYEDMAVDTLEAAANLNDLVENGVAWERGDSMLEYVSTDNEVIRRLFE